MCRIAAEALQNPYKLYLCFFYWKIGSFLCKLWPCHPGQDDILIFLNVAQRYKIVLRKIASIFCSF